MQGQMPRFWELLGGKGKIAAAVPDADNAFKNTRWTHHEGSLNCYDGFGADDSSWQAHRSGVDLATCKAACLEEASCHHPSPS